jgi:hypothetical protein
MVGDQELVFDVLKFTANVQLVEARHGDYDLFRIIVFMGLRRRKR